MKKLLLLLLIGISLPIYVQAITCTVPQGCTGTTRANPNAIILGGSASTSPFTSTYSPTIASITATTTATSTFTGGITTGGLTSLNGITLTGGSIRFNSVDPIVISDVSLPVFYVDASAFGNLVVRLGSSAGNGDITGAYNTFIGGLSGLSITNGLGYSALGKGSCNGSGGTTDGLTNVTCIGFLSQVTRSNSIILGGTGTTAVNVGIGTTSPYAKLSVVGETVAQNFTATSTTATSTFQDVTLGYNRSLSWNNGNGTPSVCLATSTNSNGLKITGCQTLTGIEQIIAGNMYTATSAQTVNTSTETSLFATAKTGTTTVPANWSTVGRTFVLAGKGVYSTPAGNVETVTGKLKYGATQVATITTAAFPASATDQPFRFNVTCTVYTVGTTGTLSCDGELEYQTVLSGTNIWVTNALGTASTPATVDFTTKSDWNVTADWSQSVFTTQSIRVNESWIDVKN